MRDNKMDEFVITTLSDEDDDSSDSCASCNKSMRVQVQAENLNPCPLLNEDVVTHISKFLPYNDLRSCRLLSTIWKDGATKEFKRRSQVSLPCNFRPIELRRNARFLREMNGYPQTDAVVTFVPSNEPIPSEVYSRNRTFFTEELKFSGLIIKCEEIKSKKVWDLIRIMVSNSSSSLKSLSLEMRSKAVEEDKIVQLLVWDEFQFPQVIDLKMNIIITKKANVPTIANISPINSKLLQGFPNLKHFSFGVGLIPVLFKDEESCSFLSHITEFTVQLYQGTYLNGSALSLLMNYQGALKKLSLCQVRITGGRLDEEDALYHLRDFLLKHRNTLEELDIAIVCTFGSMSRILQLPRFPVLKKLKFLLRKIPSWEGSVKIRLESPDQLVTDPEFRNWIDYSFHFPKLESFHCGQYSGRGVWGSDCFESWFPFGAICKTVQFMDFYEGHPNGELSLPPKYFRFPSLFPNVDNEYMRIIRSNNPHAIIDTR